MPHFHFKDKPYKTTLTSEVARLIMPGFMRPGEIITMHDGTVYKRQKDGALRKIDRNPTCGGGQR